MSVTRIQHNLSAMNAMSNYQGNSSRLTGNLEKLSSGYRINSAADDAAGLAISEKMRSQIAGLEKAQDNANDGISLIQTAEGALTEVNSMLTRLTTLATQSANGTYDSELDRSNIQEETDAILSEIDRISQSTNYNGINLLDGSLSAKGVRVTESTVKVEGAVINETSRKAAESAKSQINLNQKEGTEAGVSQTFTFDYVNQHGESKSASITFETGSVAEATAKNLAEAINKDKNLGANFIANAEGGSLVVKSNLAAEEAAKSNVTKGAAYLTAVKTNDSKEIKLDTNEIKDVKLDSTTTSGHLYASDGVTKLSKNEIVDKLNSGEKVYLGRNDEAVAGTDFSFTTSLTFDVADGVTLYNSTGASLTTDASVQSELTAGNSIYTTVPANTGDLRAYGGDYGTTVDSATANLSAGATAEAGVYTFDGSSWSLNGTAVNLADVGISATGFANGDSFEVTEAALKVAQGVEAVEGADYTASAKYDIHVSASPVYDEDGNALSTDEALAGVVTPSYTAVNQLYDGKGNAISTDDEIKLAFAKTDLSIEGGGVYTTAPKDLEIKHQDDTYSTGDNATSSSLASVTVSAGTAVSAGTYTWDDTNKEWVGEFGDTISSDNVTYEVAAGETFGGGVYFVVSEAGEKTLEGVEAVEGTDYTNSQGKVYKTANGKKEAVEGKNYEITRANEDARSGIASYGTGTTGSKTYDLSSLDDGDVVTINGTNYTFRKNVEDVKNSNDFSTGEQLASMSDAIAANSDLTEVTIKDQFDDGEVLSLQVGDTNKDYQKVGVDIADMSSMGLGLSGLDLSTQEAAGAAIDKIKEAANIVSTQRGKLGALQNRLDHTLNNLDATTQNITAAESQIRDVDMAKEMTQYSKNNILVQAAQSMLAQANSLPQGVLSLLQ